MIRIDVEEYCHSCLDFSPDIIPPTRAFSVDGKEIIQTDTIIQCKYRKRCAGIKRYLEQQMKGESRG
jgi:hypothetical protein